MFNHHSCTVTRTLTSPRHFFPLVCTNTRLGNRFIIIIIFFKLLANPLQRVSFDYNADNMRICFKTKNRGTHQCLLPPRPADRALFEAALSFMLTIERISSSDVYFVANVTQMRNCEQI